LNTGNQDAKRNDFKQIKAKNQVTKLGANWNNGLNTSAFYWNLNNASSNRNRNISSHLVNALNTPRHKKRGVSINNVLKTDYHATWQNIKK
jgi:hypothetical protein